MVVGVGLGVGVAGAAGVGLAVGRVVLVLVGAVVGVADAVAVAVGVGSGVGDARTGRPAALTHPVGGVDQSQVPASPPGSLHASALSGLAGPRATQTGQPA
ncbi:MAG TPA: hypothetical protein VH257_13500 [Chloroflexota bacterium]|jgi:hypothetical protein|nr:hypothetical protein [Chloroflexota bacterium]